jgi:cobyrinic acid a,c-diamide synthase
MKYVLPRIVIGGLRGGSGKTFLGIGLSRALRERGLRVHPFKKGPDYVDAAWLSRAAGLPCRNLDVYMLGEAGVVRSFVAHGGGLARRRGDASGASRGTGVDAPAAIAVVEGARGLYDAMDEDGSTSTARLAKLLRSPVLLVVDCTKVTRTVAAMIYGCQKLDRGVKLAGVVLNRIAGARHEANVRDAVERTCGLPVLGALPRIVEGAIPERHLGLTMPDEHGAVEEAVATAAQAVSRYVDLDRVLELARASVLLSGGRPVPAPSVKAAAPGVRVGVVRDAAFSFYYPENVEALEAAGATIVPVSATKDAVLPDIDALYIGGGFPETNAAALAANTGFHASLRAAVEQGLPVYAECGGAVFLGRSLRLGDATHAMAGVLPLDFVFRKAPQGHGYTLLEATAENPFFDAGALIRGHEFHYTTIAAWPAGGLRAGFRVRRGRGFEGTVDGVCTRNVMAVYSHVHAGGTETWAHGVVRMARRQAGERYGARTSSGSPAPLRLKETGVFA